MINIDIQHVTDEQIEILEQLWVCDTEDDVNELRLAMDPDQWHILDLLIEAIALAVLDQEIQTEVDCEQVRSILRNY